MIERGHLDDAVRQAAQRHRERRDLGAPVVGVGDHDDVGGEQVPVLGEQRAQRRRAGLLLPLDEHRHPDRADRRHARGRPPDALRCRPCRRRYPGRTAGRRVPSVRTAATPTATASPSGCTSWWAYSSTVGAPGGRGMACDDRRRAACADDADVAETRFRQQLRHRFGAAVHLVAAGRVGPHRLDADQILEIGTHGWQHFPDTGDEITHPTEASRSPIARERAQTVPRADAACRHADTRDTRAARGRTEPATEPPAPPPLRRCRLRASTTSGW